MLDLLPYSEDGICDMRANLSCIIIIFFMIALARASPIVKGQVFQLSPVLDGYISESLPGNSYFTGEYLWVGGFEGARCRSLLLFDVSSIPVESVILEARLRLSFKTGNSSVVRIHRVTSSFTGKATWVERSPGYPWVNIGGDYDPEPADTVFIPDGTPEGFYFEFDVKNILNQWVSGEAPNYGFLLEADGENPVVFYSSRALDDNFKPKLLVTYISGFNLSIQPSTQNLTVEQGGEASMEISVASQPIPVEVELEAEAPEDINVSFTPASGLTPFNSTVKVTVGSVQPGNYTLTLKAMSEYGETSVQVLLTVVKSGPPPDFNIYIIPNTVNTSPGRTLKINATINPIGGFHETVEIKISGVKWNYTALPDSGVPPFNSTIALTVPGDASPGKYRVKVKAFSGGVVKIAILTVHVELETSFKLECKDTTMNISQGGTYEATIQVEPVKGFNETVMVELPSIEGLKLSIEPGSFTPPENLTLVVKASKPGSYTFQVRFTSSLLNKTLPFKVYCYKPKIALRVELNTTNIVIYQGKIGAVRVYVNGTEGSMVTLDVVEPPLELMLRFTPETLTVPGTSILTVKAGEEVGDYIINISVSAGDYRVYTPLIVTVKESRCFIATAAYGSPVSREVEKLRYYRDRVFMKSRVGSGFIKGFNMVYYSFSPKVADYIRRHPAVAAAVRGWIRGLLLILDTAVKASGGSTGEAAAIITITVASALFSITNVLPLQLALGRLAKRKISLKLTITLAVGALIAGYCTPIGQLVLIYAVAVSISTSTLALKCISKVVRIVRS